MAARPIRTTSRTVIRECFHMGLGDIGYPGGNVPRLQGADIAAAKENTALAQLIQPHDRVQQRGFPAAVGPDDAENFAGADP